MKAQSWFKLAAVAGGSYLLANRLLAPRDSFSGKVAIVTGGSRGLGLELARQLADAGAHVAICARSSDELRIAEADLMRRSRGGILATVCDVIDRDQVREFVRTVKEQFGRIDVLINNAGVIEAGPAESMAEGDFRRSVETHLFGPLHFVDAVLPTMKHQGTGRIANIASIGGKIPPPHVLSYVAGKFALVGWSEGLGIELARHGIRVTTVCPGLMRTGSAINAGFKGQHRKEYGWFAIGSALPILTIDSTTAARRILDAIARGKREYVFPILWKAIVTGHDVFRNSSLAILEQSNRLFPSAGGIGTERRLGRESESPVTRSPLTILARNAARRNNEV